MSHWKETQTLSRENTVYTLSGLGMPWDPTRGAGGCGRMDGRMVLVVVTREIKSSEVVQCLKKLRTSVFMTRTDKYRQHKNTKEHHILQLPVLT